MLLIVFEKRTIVLECIFNTSKLSLSAGTIPFAQKGVLFVQIAKGH